MRGLSRSWRPFSRTRPSPLSTWVATTLENLLHPPSQRWEDWQIHTHTHTIITSLPPSSSPPTTQMLIANKTLSSLNVTCNKFGEVASVPCTTHLHWGLVAFDWGCTCPWQLLFLYNLKLSSRVDKPPDSRSYIHTPSLPHTLTLTHTGRWQTNPGRYGGECYPGDLWPPSDGTEWGKWVLYQPDCQKQPGQTQEEIGLCSPW